MGAQQGKPFLAWQPERGTRIAVLRRDGTGSVQWIEDGPYFVYHFMNAHEASADASLQSLAGSLQAGGDAQAAAAVTRTRSHADQTWKGSQQQLQARSASPPADRGQGHAPPAQQPKPTGD